MKFPSTLMTDGNKYRTLSSVFRHRGVLEMPIEHFRLNLFMLSGFIFEETNMIVIFFTQASPFSDLSSGRACSGKSTEERANKWNHVPGTLLAAGIEPVTFTSRNQLGFTDLTWNAA